MLEHPSAEELQPRSCSLSHHSLQDPQRELQRELCIFTLKPILSLRGLKLPLPSPLGTDFPLLCEEFDELASMPGQTDTWSKMSERWIEQPAAAGQNYEQIHSVMTQTSHRELRQHPSHATCKTCL